MNATLKTFLLVTLSTKSFFKFIPGVKKNDGIGLDKNSGIGQTNQSLHVYLFIFIGI